MSDAFEPEPKSDIEVTVTMININYGHNKKLMEKCKPLSEYSWFVDRIRTLLKEGILTLAEAAGRYNVTVSEFEALTGLKA